MSEREDWAAGWAAGNEYGTAVVDIEPAPDHHAQAKPLYEEPLEQPGPPAVDPTSDFSLEAWEDGYSTGYAKATGGDGAGSLRANPYRR